MKNKIITGLAVVLALFLIAIGMGNGMLPPGGPPAGPGPAPSGAEGGYPGAGLPDPSRKNTLFHYGGAIVTIDLAEGFIEIIDGPVNPHSDWSIIPLRKIGVGEDTRVFQNGQEKTLNDLEIGQFIGVDGIYPKSGVGLPTEYFTTNFWGTGHRGEVIHGKITIRWDDSEKLREHQAWVKKENARRTEYNLLRKYGEAQ